MGLDRALADSEIECDILAVLASQNELHDRGARVVSARNESIDVMVTISTSEAYEAICRLTLGDARAKHGKQIGRWLLDFRYGHEPDGIVEAMDANTPKCEICDQQKQAAAS